jgi:hypothetical protein
MKTWSSRTEPWCGDEASSLRSRGKNKTGHSRAPIGERNWRQKKITRSHRKNEPAKNHSGDNENQTLQRRQRFKQKNEQLTEPGSYLSETSGEKTKQDTQVAK